MNYFSENRKEELSRKAKEHTTYVANKYADSINNSIRLSNIYDDTDVVPIYTQVGTDVKLNIEIWDMDTVSAIQKCRIEQGNEIKIAALNFASYKNPGGKFIEGSNAQEEAICHDSTLFNVLSAFRDIYYENNKKILNRAMYTNRAIYSPDILFDKDHMVFHADIITCAAPNFGPGLKYGSVSKEENRLQLNSRIKFVLDILSSYSVDTVVLGAWGCGVFKQDPYEVAELFKENLYTGKYDFGRVIFAIPAGNNYNAFRDVFEI